jgi:uncharacterized tellurite resistance protein B-like protein
MARRKKSGGPEGILIVMALLGALIMAIPKEAWIGGGVIAIVVVALYLFGRPTSGDSAAPPSPESGAKGAKHPSGSVSAAVNLGGALPRAPASDVEDFGYGQIAEEPVSIPLHRGQDAAPVQTYKTPQPSRAFSGLMPEVVVRAGWVPPGHEVALAGVNLPGGMVFFGSPSGSSSYAHEPSLIDPKLAVANSGDYSVSQMGYWPSYSRISPTARRAYLNWLASGRKDSAADIGFVFLYFYGLERRAVVESQEDNAAKADLTVVAHEVRRLLDIYGSKSGSFRGYASGLLDWIALLEQPNKLYAKAVPDLSSTYELPLYLRLALGQAAVDGVPIPAALALAWARLEPNIKLRTAATRCATEFDQMFVQKYAERYGAGIQLKRNRTKLKLSYRPASAALNGLGSLTYTVDGVPDVTVLTGPVKQLDAVVEDATKDLEAFSRFIGKSPELKNSAEAYLLLPTELWPKSAKDQLEELSWRVKEKPVLTTMQALLQTWSTQSTLSKDRTLTFARALASANIGVEPDLIGGARQPRPEDHLVLFRLGGPEPLPRGAGEFQAAYLTLQLASAVAQADGVFGPEEMSHLLTAVRGWRHLTSAQMDRLCAHLQLLQQSPQSLASLKKKIEPLDQASREALASFLSTVAQADGVVSPQEIKMLEKAYKALGVDPSKVFTDVHAVASGTQPSPATIAAVESDGFKLDTSRIAELHKDTDKVSTLLAQIFADAADAVDAESVVGVAVKEAPEFEDEPKQFSGLMGLDEAHTALARLMLSRPSWTRADLMDAASDLELMLDGALEQINDAAFDVYDVPLFEGDDPVTVNSEILEKVEA